MSPETVILQPPSTTLLFSRNDPNDPRLGDIVQITQGDAPCLSTKDIITIRGYADEEGIALNGGRLGAAQGPEHLRKFLYRMTPPAISITTSLPEIRDLGDILQVQASLSERHAAALTGAKADFACQHRLLSIGGGHDYGYCDSAGFLLAFKDSHPKPLIINFDAHLDVRPTTNGFHSGTPFFRILSEFNGFDFLEIGIQPQCNSQAHWQWATDRNVKILSLPEIMAAGTPPSDAIVSFLSPWLERPHPTFISIDLDCLSTAFAPGCSQSWPLGLAAQDLYQTLGILYRRLNVRGIGIYELSPPLDHGDITSKMAAQLAYQYVFFEHL